MEDGILDQLKVVVELDPSKFKEGRDKLFVVFNDIRVNARRTAEDTEASGKQASEFFDVMTTKAMRLSTVLLAGIGIKDFIANTTKAGNTALYMSQNIGVGVQQLGEWQNVVRQMGGDAAQVGPALLGLSQALTTIQLRGKGSADLISAFQFLGITDLIDHTTGQLKTVDQLLPEIHEGLKNLAPQQAYNIGQTLGLTPDMINALRQANPEYEKLIENSKKAGTLTEQQARAAQDLTMAWGNFSSFMSRVGHEFAGEIDPVLTSAINLVTRLGEALDGIGNHGLQDLLSLIGGLGGGILGLAGGPLGVVAGVAAGSAAGAVLGNKIQNGGGPAAPPAPSSPGRRGGASGSWGTPPGGTVYVPESGSVTEMPNGAGPHAGIADEVFRIIGGIENGKEDTVTRTGSARTPFAYGKNQITLETAKAVDPSATPEKLLTASYNDQIAKKLQARYIAKYGNNLDAIMVAYNAGEGAADRFIANGGSVAGLAPETVNYITKERAMAASYAASSNSTTTTANIGSIHVSTQATDANGIAASMRSALADNQLLSQANTGPT